ncbi:hypothetical protein GCK32_021340, partial [Trichostrongylus colubriformis]
MELSALTLAMRLTNSVVAQIASIISVTKIIILSDSEIVLNWIRTKPRPIIGPFIRNRVLEVRNIVAHLVEKGYKIEFGHIPSQNNPADCATRGLDKTLLKDHFWWKGPGFLIQAETWKDEYTPVTLETSQDSEESETDQAGEDDAVKVHTLTRTKDNHTDLFQNIRFSALSSIKRVVAYVMRFIRIVVNRVNTKRTASIKLTDVLKKGVGGQHTTIHGWEMGMSNMMLVKQHQVSHLNNEIRKSLHRLNLYEDQYGVWRCRGRLGKSELDDSAKFPIMAERNCEDDTKYLSNLILKRHTALNRVQDDLGAIYEVFQQQISIASMAQLQWNYTKTEESFVLGTPASRIKTIAKQMKDLMVAREKMSRMGTRFIYTNRYYKEVAHLGDQHPNVSVQEWDRQAESALLQLEKNKKRFDEVIKEMEVEMEQAEKDFNVGPCHTNAQHINTLFRRAFENLTATDKDNSEKRFADVQDKLKEQSEEILRLKNIVEKPGVGKGAKDDTNEMNDDVYFSRMVDEVRVVNEPGPIQELPALVSESEDSDGEGDVHSEEDDRMDIDEPLEEPSSLRNRERVVEELPPDRIVEIVHEGRDSDRAPESGREDHSRARRRSPSRPRRERNDRRRRELRWLIDELEERMAWMERDLQDFPYRKKESRSPYMNPSLNCAFCDREGEHFSDSCPNVVNGDRRWEIMRERSYCQYCLKRCGYYEDCAYRRKGCYYCNRVKGTAFEFLIPDDRGHHTALCNIPDRKNEARRQTEE